MLKRGFQAAAENGRALHLTVAWYYWRNGRVHASPHAD
jgi:hypothetical protein